MNLAKVIEDVLEDSIKLVDHFANVLEVCWDFLHIVVVIVTSSGIRRDVAEIIAFCVTVTVVIFTLRTFLSNDGIEWVEVKDLDLLLTKLFFEFFHLALNFNLNQL